MSLSLLLFWPLCAVVMAGALSTALARNMVYAALSLGVTLAGVSGLYLFLQAEFLAAVQLTVYVGGILVLLLFGVMFSRDILGTHQTPKPLPLAVGIVTSLLVLGVMIRTGMAVIHTRGANALSLVRSAPETWDGNFSPGSTVHLGDLLASAYLVPFLVVAMLLTVVLVGALVLVRKEGE